MRVFVTGLTGTLGTELAREHASRGDQVWGCARSEVRAVEWLRDHLSLATPFVCDARRLADPSSDVGRLLPLMDRVYHCAAMKHVDLCETNPLEAFRQNVELTNTVAIACALKGVPLIHVSSDKACLPQGVYGATKLLAERIALREGAAVVRLGNLIGSSGSVFAVWKAAVALGKPVRVTDPQMTRYFMGASEAARFLADEAMPGKVVIPNPLKAAVMGELAESLGNGSVQVVGLRAGETQHQWLIAPREKCRTYGCKVVLTGEGADGFGGRGVCSADSLEWGHKWDTDELLALAGIER